MLDRGKVSRVESRDAKARAYVHAGFPDARRSQPPSICDMVAGTRDSQPLTLDSQLSTHDSRLILEFYATAPVLSAKSRYFPGKLVNPVQPIGRKLRLS